VPVKTITVSGASETGSGSHPIVPTKPVIVVLPFENHGDPEQTFFSDGITDEITDRLTRFRALSVIGQHSASSLRGGAPDFQAIRDKLHADFVVTGRIQREAERIRIAVRLSDARTEAAVWAERYDRALASIFELQDEVTDLIAAAVAHQLDIEISGWSGKRVPANFAAYEFILQGHWQFKKISIAATENAKACFERALSLDPRNAEAMSSLAMCYTSGWMFEFSEPKLKKGVDLAAEAIEFDSSAAKGHAVFGLGVLYLDGLEAARPPIERALALNPNDWFGLTNRSMLSIYAGDTADARRWIDLARRLNRAPPSWLTEFECISKFQEGLFGDVLPGVEPVDDGAWDMMYALACYGHLGLKEKARLTLKRFRDQGREIDFLSGAAREPYRDQAIQDLLNRGLRMALD
jgi:adenylate cyclase